MFSGRNAGLMYAWGEGNGGRLGTGNTTDQFAPAEVSITADTAQHVTWRLCSAGGAHSLGIAASGLLYGWGNNASGQVGLGSVAIEAPYSPTAIGSPPEAWADAAAGSHHSVAIKESGRSLWAWGLNNYGQLGDTTTDMRASPVLVSSDAWASVSATAYRTAAIKADGTLWAWGYNQYGMLGDGTSKTRDRPARVGSATWLKVSAGRYHTLGIQSNGTLWAWGYNNNGQIGDLTTTTRLSPVQIGSATWIDIAAGDFHSMGIQSDGTLWTWGRGIDYQLGNGSNTSNRFQPGQVGSSKWIKVAANTNGTGSFEPQYSAAVRSDGVLFTWGSNRYGQLGNMPDVDITGQAAPTQVGDLKWKSVSAGARHMLGVSSSFGLVELIG